MAREYDARDKAVGNDKLPLLQLIDQSLRRINGAQAAPAPVASLAPPAPTTTAAPVTPVATSQLAPPANAAGPGMTSNPAPVQQQANLESQWGTFFRNPAVISSLIQFGASALTPGTAFGEAVTHGAAAAGRTMQFQQAGEQATAAQALKSRQVDLEERRTVADERKAVAAERKADAEADRNIANDERKHLTEQAKLDLQKRRLEEYLIPSMQKAGKNKGAKPFDPTRMIFQGFFDQAMNAEFESTLDQEDPEYIAMTQDPVGWAMKKTAQSMGAGGAGIAPQSAANGPPSGDNSAGGIVPPPSGSRATGQPAGTAATPTPIPTTTPTPAPSLDEKGRVPVDQITPEQWGMIFADPAAEQEMLATYPEYQQLIQSKKMRHSGNTTTNFRGYSPWSTE